jgi:3-hydroxyisobutyrate dehydrogenase-like beta-hydroxyacid dehydrogenase
MRVGFIGLGNMGQGMALNLVKAGFDTTVCDVRPETTEVLATVGATVAPSPAGVAEGAVVVCVTVFNEAQLRAVVVGSDNAHGVLATAAPGTVITVHSTVSPGVIRDLAEVARKHDVHLIDVPMSGGGEIAAREGTLSFMVGGDQAAFELCQPVLEAMSSVINQVGPLGAGMTCKILSNFISTANITILREAFRIATAEGLAEQRFLEIVNDNKIGSSWWASRWDVLRGLEQSSWNGAQNIIDMFNKDLNLAQSVAVANEVDAPTLQFIATVVNPTVTGSVTK